MSKYNIEGGFNFYEELYKSIDENNEDENIVISENTNCLITDEPLKENFVKLDCNHKFNYIPLYNDIVNHKNKYNQMERRLLDKTEIRCPYCRNVQKTLLPYYEELGLKKVHGVNYIDETYGLYKKSYLNYESEYKSGKCEAFVSNPLINGSYAVKHPCYNTYVKKLEEKGKCYCYFHYKYFSKQLTKEKKQADKDKIKAAKELLKLEKIKEKEALKIKKLEEKMLKKSIKNNEENIIISQNKELTGCTQLLKTGKNAGNPCCAKVHLNGFCKRHLKKSIVNDAIVNDEVSAIEEIPDVTL
jgi:hypothetical protein